MANVQTHFNKFHDIIKTSYDDNHSLRDKRDLLLRNLQYGLQRLFSHPPSYTWQITIQLVCMLGIVAN